MQPWLAISLKKKMFIIYISRSSNFSRTKFRAFGRYGAGVLALITSASKGPTAKAPKTFDRKLKTFKTTRPINSPPFQSIFNILQFVSLRLSGAGEKTRARPRFKHLIAMKISSKPPLQPSPRSSGSRCLTISNRIR